MAESTLSLTYADLAGEVGNFLGWGRGAALGDQTWDTHQQAAIDSAVKSGLRLFYYPTVGDPDSPQTYDWSFLRPTASAVLAQGAQTVPLYDDFGSPEGRVTVTASGTTVRVPWELPVTGEGNVRTLYAQDPTRTGRPLALSVRPTKGTTATGGTRFEFYVFPAADQAYTLGFTYYVNPDYLSTAFPYHMGGVAHAETVKAAVKAAAELDQDDMRGPQWAYFQERLAASVATDRRLKPEFVGYNGDRSDYRHRRFGRLDRHGLDYGGIAVNGTVY